jgi:hypothetical protein
MNSRHSGRVIAFHKYNSISDYALWIFINPWAPERVNL